MLVNAVMEACFPLKTVQQVWNKYLLLHGARFSDTSYLSDIVFVASIVFNIGGRKDF